MTRDGDLIENAYVVRDLDAAIAFWRTAGGAGPFFVGESALPEARCIYRGAPSPLRTRFAFGVTGTMAIELVQQVDPGPSVFTEMLERRGEGLHHLKYATPSRDAEVARLTALGFDEVARLDLGGPVISFVDATDRFGVFMEVMDYDNWRTPHRALLRAHADWDGRTDPVRPFSRLSEHFGTGDGA